VSAAGLGLPAPDPVLLRAAIDQVIAANGFGEARIRVTMTGGPSPLGSERGSAGPLTIVAGGPLAASPDLTDVVVVPWPRNERGALAGLKTTSYGENVVALAYAKERGAGEAIFANLRGHLCEGTGTNVFVGIGGRLVTPPLSSGCLAGVTRALVLEVVDCEEAELPVEALAEADEAFLSSTTREVLPIRAVDGQGLGSCPGPLSKAAAAAFQSLIAKSLDP
jgi:branched-chain amino acid aminotransferase